MNQTTEQVAGSELVLQQPGTLIAANPGADGLLAAITAAAQNPQIDMAKVERLYAIHKDVVDRQNEAAFNAALSRAQQRIQPIAHNAENEHTHSTYSKLDAIMREIAPIFGEEGLSLSFTSETKNDADPIAEGCVRTVGILAHKDGFSRRYHIDLPPDEVGAKGNTNKTRLQALGSTTSYARRYLTMMIFNVATGDDNDGNAVDREPRRTPKGRDIGRAPAEYSGKLVGDAPLRILRVKLADSGRSEADLCELLKIKTLEEMPIEDVNRAMEWAKK